MAIEKIFAIPHFHYDVEWWKTDDLYARDALKIISRALELLDEYPQFTYVLDQVLAIRPFWEAYPKKREKLLKYIKEGRIELVGGTFCAPDENIPTGEALVRQFIYGKRFLKETLQGEAKVGWEIDEFGHPSQMPQLLLKSGLSSFVFARGVIPWNAKHPLDFYWQSPDGSKILTHWFAASYSGMLPLLPTKGMNLSRFKKEVRARLVYEGERSSASLLMIPFGTDFSIPTTDWLSFVDEWNKKEKIGISFSLPHKYFEEISKEDDFPLVSGEFNPILTGGYESREKVKKYCRLSQNKALEAEKLNTLAFIFGKEYPQDDFDTIWENILENDFHDIICGTGTDKVYKNTLSRYKVALELIEKNSQAALKVLSQNIDTTGEGKPLIVFNTLSWERSDVVEVQMSEARTTGRSAFRHDYIGGRSQKSEEREQSLSLKDSEGKEVPFVLEDDKLLFIAENVPSLGYKLYYLACRGDSLESLKQSGRQKTEDRGQRSEDGGQIVHSPPDRRDILVPQKSTTLENKFYRIEVDEKLGGIRSIYDKEAGCEVLDTTKFLGNEVLVEEDVGNLWTVQKTGKVFRQEKYPVEIKLVEESPVRRVLQIKGRHHQMEKVQRIILYSDLPRIDFETKINFKGKDKRVRVMFAPQVKGKAVYETPYCVEERKDGHWCAMNFVDISDGKYGLALLNTGNPGYEVKDNIIGLTLFRSVSLFAPGLLKFIFKNFFDLIKKVRQGVGLQIKGLNVLEYPLYPYHGLMLREWASSGGPPVEGGWTILDHFVPVLKFWQKSDAWEQGEHYFRYSLYPHQGDFRKANLPRRGYEINNPLLSEFCETHSGDLPREFSFLELDEENLILSVLKKAEKGERLTLRIYETQGRETNFNLKFFKEIKSAEKTSLTEDEVYTQLTSQEGNLRGEISKWEVATLSLNLITA